MASSVPKRPDPLFAYESLDLWSVNRDLSEPEWYINAKYAACETAVIFGLFLVVVAGRAITRPEALRVLYRADLWTWVVLFFLMNTLLKTYHPKFDDQLLNAAIFTVVYTLMIPLKIE